MGTAEHKARIWDGVVREFTPDDTPTCDGKDVPYLEPGRVTDADTRQFQKENCVSCPVLIDCARHALNYEPYGTWGLTENQRASLGGVVATEWANKKVDPMKAIHELEEAGFDLDTITEIAKAAGPRNTVTFAAIRTRQQQIESPDVASLARAS